MIAIASKEIYRLDIKINVNGDKESSNKVKKVEETAEKAKKKLKDLGNQTASPTAKLNDKMSSALDKIESKTKKLSDKTISPTAKLKDNATSGLDKVKSATEKLNNKEAKVKVKAEDQASSVIEKANNKLTSWLKAGTKKVISIALAGTLAMGGFGATTAIKTYSDFEKGLSNVKAVSQATDSEMKQLSNTAKSLGASTEWSAVQVTQAEELLGQAGFSTKENISALPGLLSLASAGDLDLAAATDIASGTLRSFNIDASNTSHVADVLALSASATNSDVTDLGETMKYVAPVSASLGISFEDTAAAAGLLSNQNIKGSQAGTVLRQAMARLANPTKEAAGLMKTYGINAFDTQGNMKPLSGVVDNLNSSLGKLTSQQRADIISTIFGTESMSGVLALMNQGGQSLSDLSKRLSDANGAAKDMANTKLDNLSGQWKILKSAVEGMNIALGERLAPYAKQFVTWFTGKIPDITDGIVNAVDYLSNHTEDIKETAIAIGTVVTAIAGFNIAGSIGNSISGISNLVSLFKGASVAKDATEAAVGISKVGLAAKILPALFSPAGLAITAGVAATAYGVMSYNSLMNRSIDTATEELTIGEKIINKFTGSAYKSAKELQESGVKYTDFGEGISDSFKKAVRETAKSGTELLMNIKKIDMSSYSTSDRENKITNRINDYAYDIINALENKKNSETKVLKDALSADGDYSLENDSAVSSIGEYYDNVTEKIQVARDKVYDITSQAYADNRELAVSELEEIKGYIDQMNSLKLDAIDAKNTYDQAYARSKFTTDASKITDTDSASELLKSSYKDIDDAYKDKIADLDGHIAVLEKTLSETTEESKKSSLEKSIDELRNTRGSYADSNWNEKQAMYQIIMDQNSGAASSIDKYTGDKVDGTELDNRDTMQKMINSHIGASNIKESGNYTLFNDLTKQWENVTIAVDDYSKEITGFYNETANKGAAYSNVQKKQLDILRESYTNSTDGIINAIDVISNSTLNTSTGEFKMGNAIVASMQDIQKESDGVITGMTQINGTQVYIKADASGAIEAIGDTREELNQVPPITAADVTTDGTAQETKSEITSVITKADEADGKTITITTIFKKVSQWFDDIFKGNSDVDKNANGTHYSESGLSTVDERGWELADRTVPVIGQYNNNPLVNLQKGTKIRNHMNSVNDMRAAVQQEVARKTPKQKVEVYQPQVAMAGGGNQFSFGGMNINVNGNQDIEAMINEAMQQFGQNLRDAFTNIKK
ncbi:MAG: phage tail tape measure protein [Clostridium butyricum]|uniref:phage tail tape measure protein n=1 Tax=Clostridium sp. TaxID=1506 RepID=UPI0028FE2E6F|nr:phage tail tape measure protein [Clostridium sp.]MDU1116436.1 phage tail tape measure protein [Clostridium sp.]MDU7711279.1 phage tail tape measure protein [Clostridium butyricum]